MDQANKKLTAPGGISPGRLAGLLEHTNWATEFSWDQLLLLCEYIHPLKVNKGAVVFKEGALEKSLGIIVKGSIQVMKQSGADINYLTRLSPPQTFGEMSLIDDEPRSASGIALEETLIFFMSRSRFIALAQANPVLGFKLLWKISKIISQRLRRTTGQLIDFLG